MGQQEVDAYERLLELEKELRLFYMAGNVISWDSFTSIPPGSRKQRAEVNGFRSKLWHRMLTNPEKGVLLEKISRSEDISSYEFVKRRNIQLIQKEYDRWTKVSESFVSKMGKQRSITNEAREKAKAKKDWKIFEPEFEKMFKIKVEHAEHLMDVVGVSTHYDVHVDYFEEGMRTKYISDLFDEITKHVVPMIKKYSAICEEIDDEFLRRTVDKQTQIKIIEKLADFAGYDFKSENAIGKLGETEHPFMCGSYDDVRIAMRYEENNFLVSFLAFIHESGHALNYIHLNRELMYQPVGMNTGFGMGESQSRFLENMVGKSPEFLEYFLPKLNTLTGGTFSDISLVDFVRAVNKVKAGPIRVESNELTYPLHIIIRFEIERDLFSEKIDVKDVPVVWNELYEKYLGIEVKHDGEGALQDTHWGIGQFGHFPCYILGDMFAAQLAESMRKQIPDWREQIGKGKFIQIREWMTENMHTKGSLYNAPDLIKHVTGNEMTSKYYIDYLDSKYSGLFS